jgi:hypothetical protein
MIKYIKIYARISATTALAVCIHAGIFYLVNSDNDKLGGDGLFGVTMVIAFEFTLYNGILLTIAGIYLLLKGEKGLGWASIAAVLVFYLTVLLINFYDRPAGV